MLRYGAYSPDVIDRLRWMSSVLGPLLQAAVRGHGPVDVSAILAQMLQMGDEGHNRNRAGTLMLLRDLLPSMIDSGLPVGGRGRGGRASSAATTTSSSTSRCRRASSPSTPPATSRARPWWSRWPATAPTSASRSPAPADAWFTAPGAQRRRACTWAITGPADANPDIGDSAITETAGLGGFAMAAAPAIVRFVGGTVADALRHHPADVRDHAGRAPAVPAIPVLDFRGTPTGIDVTLVVRTGILPQINTGMAGKVAGTGQVGAGLVTPPAAIFPAALRALARSAAA